MGNFAIDGFQAAHLDTPIIGLENRDHPDAILGIVIDSMAKINAVNALYPGAITVFGSPSFIGGRGAAAINAGDGIVINPAILDPDGLWRNHFGEEGQLSLYLEKGIFLDNTDSATKDVPARVTLGTEPKSYGYGPYRNDANAFSLLNMRMDGVNNAQGVRIYGTDSTNQLHNGLITEFAGSGIHKRDQGKLHSHGKEGDTRTHYALTQSWNGGVYEEFADGTPYILGGWTRGAVATSFYRLGEHYVACNKVRGKALQSISLLASLGGSGTTIGTSCLSDNGNPVYVYALVLARRSVSFKRHQDFRMFCTFGASFSTEGGISSTYMSRVGFLDNTPWMRIAKLAARNGYRIGFLRNMSQGGHTIAYRESPYAYPTPLTACQQGDCPAHPGVNHLEDLLALNPSLIMYSDGPNDTSFLRDSDSPLLRQQWLDDRNRLVTKLLSKGAKVSWTGFMGTPYYDNLDLNSWLPNMQWYVEESVKLPQWVLENLGAEAASRFDYVDTRPYFAAYLQAGDTYNGLITTSPNPLYEETGDGAGTGMHLIYLGNKIQRDATIDSLKRLTGLE